GGCSPARTATPGTRTPWATGGGKAKADAGVVGVKLHDLRHWFVSGLIAATCDVVTVQRALGHKSATTTLNTYSHLWPTAEDRTRKAAAEMMTAVSKAAEDSVRTTGG
ncbi:MAG TPA: tyrosine-type recombinase/integrase, partial [Acidimicrobiales bacterium]